MNSCRSLVPSQPQMLRNFTAKLRQPRMQMFSQSFVIGFLAAAGLASGWVPSLSEHSPEQMFSTAAVAQSAPSKTDLQNYARAVLAVEEVRQLSYRDIKKIVGSGGIPAIACHKPKSLQVTLISFGLYTGFYNNSGSRPMSLNTKARGS